MKYIITEEQYNLIVEQSDSKFGLERFGYNPKKPETLDKAAEKFNEFNNSLDKHTLLTILQIGIIKAIKRLLKRRLDYH